MTSELQTPAAQAVLPSGSGVLVSRPAGAHRIAAATSKPAVTLQDWGTVLEMPESITVALDDAGADHQVKAVALLRAWLSTRPLGIAAIAFGPGHNVPAVLVTALAEQRILVVRSPGHNAREQAEGFLAEVRQMDAQGLRHLRRLGYPPSGRQQA